ncbi:TRAP transporter substrate-binding protein DctP [Mesobacillus harenae]|uniref:TRAP transporter substrate-binding protein DctP n=1 Tax=Mesobacillus harenae TaxID=2213203 RepID=UPI001580AAB1|nr:TRAP transporter substrate-binding protein DctP [Mesobacillus harenae]
MTTKSISIIGIILAVFLVVSGCNSNTNEVTSENSKQNPKSTSKAEIEEKITLKFASSSPANAPYTKGVMEPFMDRVTELTNGQVQFEFYPAEQLGKTGDLLDLAKDGATDIAYYGPLFYPSKMPIGSALTGMPGLYKTGHQGSVNYHSIVNESPILETDYLSNNVRPIITTMVRQAEFWTKGQEINVPNDLKGLKVRASGGVTNKFLEYLGATPVFVNTPDMYEAFDQGILDVLHMFASTLNSYGLGELLTYGTEGARFGGGLVGFVINEDVYQGLPENVQKAIIQAGDEITGTYSKNNSDKENERVIKEWDESEEITIHHLTEDESKHWEDAANEFNKSWLKEQDSKEFIQAYEMFKEALKEHD